MSFALPGWETETEHVLTAIREANVAVMRVYDEAGKHGLDVEKKSDDRGPVTEADKAANEILVRHLAQAFGDDAILAEESADDKRRLTAERFWCIDPLDGTKEFIKRNGEFSLMVGLVDRASGRPIFGVVLEPVADYIMIAGKGAGAWLLKAGDEPRRLSVSARDDGSQLRIIVSRSHPDPETLRATEILGAPGTTPCGSVGLKVGRIVQDRADVYMNFSGRTMFWDTCGPEMILEEGGGKLTNLDGQHLDYSAEDTTNRASYVATNGVCHDLVVDACRKAAGL